MSAASALVAFIVCAFSVVAVIAVCETARRIAIAWIDASRTAHVDRAELDAMKRDVAKLRVEVTDFVGEQRARRRA